MDMSFKHKIMFSEYDQEMAQSQTTELLQM